MKAIKLLCISMVILFISTSACSKQNLSELTTPSTLRSVVKSVTITPNTTTITKGQTFQFNAIVDAIGETIKTVTWTVEGGITETNIDQSGLLTVNINETTTSLTIKATSTIETSKSGTASVTIIDTQPTVTSVEVTPAEIIITRGEQQQFSAVVSGEYNPSPEVEWSVTGVATTGTTILSSGLLIVSIGETATSLTVIATSIVDPTKSGDATVTVVEAYTPPTVTDIVVTPAIATVIRGETQLFTALVNGENNPPQDVTWSVEPRATGTTIDTDGLLTVDIAETTLELIVTAISDYDPTQSGTATVTVINPPPTVTSINVTPATITITKGFSEQFHAEVIGAYNPSQDVLWTVNSSLSTITQSGFLTVNISETAPTLTVTATSTYDDTQFGTATVTVSDNPPTVTGVEVTPTTVTVGIGSTQQFTAEVHGDYSPPQDVTWAVTGNTSGNTNITPTGGLLTVALNETATSLTISATSSYEPSQNGTATVTVPQIDDISVTPSISLSE